MKFKNVEVGDFVQIKKSKCTNGFQPDTEYEVLFIEPHDNNGKNILVQHELQLGWFKHRDLKKPIKRESEPQLKQLEQSVFDGLDEKWRWAAINVSGALILSTHPIEAMSGSWVRKRNLGELINHGFGYDASNWKNSLITRDTVKELSGSELCMAMLARGDTRIMCRVYDVDRQHDITHVIRAYSDGKFHTKANRWTYAIPINNKGEPLTAKDVGLQQGNT